MFNESDPTIARVKAALLPVSIQDDADQVQRQGQRRAAVLMPLVWRDDWQVILTQRPDSMPSHPGQISFPGGGIAAGETAYAAALRETHEEVGIDAQHISVLGRLPSFNAVSDYRVTPFVGLVNPEATLIPDPREVDDIFEVPFNYVMNPDNHIPRDVQWKDESFTLYDMPYDDRDGIHRNIWGMTAMMMYRLWQRGFAA